MSDRSDASSYLNRITLVTASHRYPLGGPPAHAPAATGPGSYRPTSLAAEARRWSYVMRSRERWRDSDDVLALHQRDAMATLNAFGIDEAAVREMAQAGHLVVEMPYEAENQGWDGRTFPWEFVLSRATRPFRHGGPQLTVMRHLVVDPPTRGGQAGWAKGFAPQDFSGRKLAPRVLFVQSFPGGLAQHYNAQQEQDRLCAAFGMAAHDARWQVLDTPTLAELHAACERFRPEIVHITGCDTHQGLQLLRDCAGPQARIAMGDAEWPVAELLAGAQTVYDGLLLRRDDGLPCVVLPQALGAALVAGRNAPFFVGLNLWNSAARLAPMLLPVGVLSSLGFQDSFDDSLGEYFFENLYGLLRVLDWCLPVAFEGAWAEIRRQVDLVPGTGIALWARAALTMAQPLPVGLPALPHAARAHAVPVPTADWRAAAPPLDRAPAPPARSADGKPLPASLPAQPSVQPGPVEMLVLPKTEINYAELHNHRPLFDRFELRCTTPDVVPRLHIVVELHCGPERARYECELELREPRVNLQRRIQVPLTAALMRSISEAVLSSLFVQIRVDGLAVLTDTYPLRLLPVDQWRDNLSSGKWLPSFVLPRDPAVRLAVAAAQRYVRVLRDDPAAGFEGYQCAPGTDEAALEQVDQQVEAIWAALLHEWQLGYVNPPPAYSAHLDSQRLRTPSAIHASRMGTCIDLAAMFAGCLELVDIYPVIFLLKGHALPGYWRHGSFQPEFRAALLAGRGAGADDDAESDGGDTGRVQRAPWWTIDHAQVWKLVSEGRLVPLETVRLTGHCGFRQAREAGIEALRDAARFDSILDIATAREHLITPLPILADRA